MNKKVAIPFGITLAGVVLMIIMLFLPYASATSEYKEVLNQNKEGIFAQEIFRSTEYSSLKCLAVHTLLLNSYIPYFHSD